MKTNNMWLIFAFMSAVFASLSSIFAKVGINGVNSNLATAIRTVVVLAMAWLLVFITGGIKGVFSIDVKGWVFLALSGLATGASWLCYYRALALGEVSKVAPVDKLSLVITIAIAMLFLHEKVDVKAMIGAVMITVGTIIMAI